jgi:hypothetical protein
MWHVCGRGIYKVLMGKLEGKCPVEALGEDGRVI